MSDVIRDLRSAIRFKYTVDAATTIVALEMGQSGKAFSDGELDYLASLTFDAQQDDDYDGSDLIADYGGSEASALGHLLGDTTTKLVESFKNYEKASQAIIESNGAATDDITTLKSAAVNSMIEGLEILKANVVENYRTIFGLNGNSKGFMADYLKQMEKDIIQPLERYIGPNGQNYELDELAGLDQGFDFLTEPVNSEKLEAARVLFDQDPNASPEANGSN